MHTLSQITHHRKEDKMHVLLSNMLHLITIDLVRYTYVHNSVYMRAAFFLQKKLLQLLYYIFSDEIFSRSGYNHSPPFQTHSQWALHVK